MTLLFKKGDYEDSDMPVRAMQVKAHCIEQSIGAWQPDEGP